MATVEDEANAAQDNRLQKIAAVAPEPKEAASAARPHPGPDNAASSGCAGGPIAWMVRKSLVIQTKLQIFFGWQSALVIKHPSRCIWGTIIWMNLVLPAMLLGRVELRNEEVLLPQDARELDAQNSIREQFGPDWGE